MPEQHADAGGSRPISIRKRNGWADLQASIYARFHTTLIPSQCLLGTRDIGDAEGFVNTLGPLPADQVVAKKPLRGTPCIRAWTLSPFDNKRSD